MIHSPFGWSYPPGCSSVPGDEPDPPCMVCWQYEDKCKCPVCHVCEVIGDPNCYMNHGLKLSEEQISLRLQAELDHEREQSEHAEYMDALERSEFFEPEPDTNQA